MLSTCPFDPAAALRRRASEPEWRRFPSLWQTFPATKHGFLDSVVQLQTGAPKAVTAAVASAALEKFFSEHRPQALYPYVWVRNAQNLVADARGMHHWLHEVLVSYDASDMPKTAPIRFDNGVLLTLDTSQLMFGNTSRYGAGTQDLVRQYCAYLHIGPAQRSVAELDEETDDECEPEPASGPNP
ncbi:hypothetical protein [Janthinobacterium sp. HLX7-2]|uniref:hypothetical protein n=1 Tax=Janthinobacterium sp. HLX7-2 TaxID=1259331 RepID=UPI003F241030